MKKYNNNISTYEVNTDYLMHTDIAFVFISENGRLYDPVIARVLSPDNNVQNPNNPQNYNRYSYCYNNPLKFTDPDGEWVHLAVGAAIGGTMNLIMNINNVGNFWQGLGYFGVGAVAGVLSAGVGVGIQTASAGASFWAGFVGSAQGISTILSVGYSSSFLTGAASGFGAGFVGGFGTGFGNNLVGRNTFGDSFKTGITQGLYGGAIGGLSGGIAGGIDAYRDGRNPITGEPTLKTKLELLLEKNNFALHFDIGEAGVSDVYLANNKNLSDLKGYRNSFGEIVQPDGQTANGFCKNGRGFDITYDGYVRFKDNEIYLSKNTVRRMWRGSVSARETLFHEWFHARDYYTGTADFFFQQYGHDWTKTSNMLEFRAHSFNYSRLQNINRLNLMEHYSRLFFGFSSLY
ncbi:MAG: RHS repeat-associated core domain-containing protein [Bacteroidales bacterium]|nr:RHS repeat-associated core domain-containing protein [Bacteroidales bacterium]